MLVSCSIRTMASRLAKTVWYSFLMKGVGPNLSFVISTASALAIAGGLSLFKNAIAASPLLTIGGGFIVSFLFLFTLTAISNFEVMLLGDGYQVKLFPEVILALVASLTLAGSVHRVCVTTGFAFSAIALYYLHSLSQKGVQQVNYTHLKKKTK